MIIHKRTSQSREPLVSVVLLDWSVRESFHALEWLSQQSVPREQYELIWIELYSRVIPEAMEKADMVITCGQRGLYHKHIGYNFGLLHSKAQIITVCDSDAVFPPNFIASIIETFKLSQLCDPPSLVLMHYEWRTAHTYPEELSDIGGLSEYCWEDLWPNVGACMSVRRSDAVRLGGFDEHPSFRGYVCGPYDLGWRLVNAGIPEIWHDKSIALWHFAHPDPPATFSQPFSLKRWREIAFPAIEGHALTAVEAFSTGRLLPLQENRGVYNLRMSQRQVGTTFEERYARFTGPAGFSKWVQLKLRLSLITEPYIRPYRKTYWKARVFILFHFLMLLKTLIGPRQYGVLKGWWHSQKGIKAIERGKQSKSRLHKEID